jgi:selenocysteine lyase/cysteine desulfurase
MPGTPNVVGFYRAALAFELQDEIGLNFIHKRE